jgi:hypothetical protein
MNSPIKSYLQEYRLYKAKLGIAKSSVQFINFVLPLFALIVSIEAIFYNSIPVRNHLTAYLLGGICSLGGYIILEWLLHRYQFFGNSTDSILANDIGEHHPHIKDRLLNALQLDAQIKTDPKGKDLAKAAILQIRKDVDLLPTQTTFESIPRKLKHEFSYILGGLTILFLLTFNFSSSAINRLMHPNQHFNVPVPFTLTSLSNHVDVLGGDTISVSIAGFGELPDSISIVWDDKDGKHRATTHESGEIYTFTFPNIRQNVIWQGQFENNQFFSSWDVIKTNPDTIFVTDRPIIESVNFTIISPPYTGESAKSHPGNITNLQLLTGSKIQIQAEASKPLQKAWIYLEGTGEKYLNIQGTSMENTLTLGASITGALFCEDENGVRNLNPTYYRFNVYHDSAPDVLVTSPEFEFELDESSKINITFQTSDDYGFSSAWIEYKLIAPYYLGRQDTSIHKREIMELSTSVRSQQVIHYWDISSLHPAPEDEIHFTIHIADNNTVTGPSISTTPLFIGRYPSIEDMFNQLEEEEAQVEAYTDEMVSDLEDVQDLVESLQLEILKSDEMSWEQQQKAEETIQQMQEVFNQLEDIQETVQKIQEQAEKNNLISDKLTEKFEKFQELLDSIMSEELMAAMEKMQEAMQNMDMQEMLDALEDFDYDLEAFEEQLDRFIDMFEQAIAEQKMDEVIKRLEKLTEEQQAITENLTTDPNVDIQELASRERRQEEQFKGLEDAMEAAAKAMEELSDEAAQQMANLKNSELTQETKSEIKSARKNMQNKDKDASEESAQAAKVKLDEMLARAKEIQEQFQEDTVDEMMDAFLAVVRNILYISQGQEKLVEFTETLNSRNPNLPIAAAQQNKIKRENLQLISQMIELSKKTFYITPAISRALGRTTVAMDRAIGELEQKQTIKSKKAQKGALDGLNETAYLLLLAMEEMQSSGSASGFESYMEQLEGMSEQQKGINKGTMQMGQMGMMAQQQMMQGLQGQQEALQQALQEMMKEMPGGDIPGGLSKAEQDMEEVINDFKRNQVSRQTMERQEQILSRMLDSQKSMTQRDFSEKRKSKTGGEFTYDGPTGLPADKGQRDLFLINAMESALQEKHSREYQQMMKHYFRGLQEASEKTSE